MNLLDLIINKRNGLSHTSKELYWLVNNYTQDSIPDYQMSAWLMAVYFNGMTDEEIAALTMAMAESGKIVDLSSIPGVKVDKHSTGGVGDTVTLIVAPLVAAAGIPVAKMSGRGLGFTGGTIDKLESIPGLNTALSEEKFIQNIRIAGWAISAQNKDIAPADGKIYSLRDVTGTVESIPLIASSIMSKKIAAGADKIVLDVKFGSGAFMKTAADAVKLANTMVRIGTLVHKETLAVISNMDQPLGNAVGNSLEVIEAIQLLKGHGEVELKQLCLTLGAHMLKLAQNTDFTSNYKKLEFLLKNGTGLESLRKMLRCQGGNEAIIDCPEQMPTSTYTYSLTSKASGYVQTIMAHQIGRAAAVLGAGRHYKNQPLDLTAGIVLKCRIGQYIQSGETLAIIHYNNPNLLEEAIAIVNTAIKFGPEHPIEKPLIFGTVSEAGVSCNS